MHYIAFFEGHKNGRYDVTFPQFPGCVTQGDSFAEAQREAAEVLAFHVEGMREDGIDIPDPSRAGDALVDFYSDPVRARNAGLIPVAIPLLSARRKSVRIQVTMDEHLITQIDAVSKNRSAFLAEAAQARLSAL